MGTIFYDWDRLYAWLFHAINDVPKPLLALTPDILHIIGQAEFHHNQPSSHSAFAMLFGVLQAATQQIGRGAR